MKRVEASHRPSGPREKLTFRAPRGLDGFGAQLCRLLSPDLGPHHGGGRILADHGLQVRYDLERYPLYVEVGDCYSIEPTTTVDRRCRANRMALDLSNRP